MSFRRSRTNRMAKAHDFRAAWDAPDHGYNHRQVAVLRTGAGNINNTGVAGDYHAPTVTRHHEQFASCIEPGVRELVLLFAREVGWTTYTSCQGHIYHDRSIRPVERHVGLLPRNQDELADTVAGLRRVARAFNRKAWLQPISLELLVHTLDSEEDRLPAVDLYFSRRMFTRWQSYFSALAGCYELALQLTREVLLNGGVRSAAEASISAR